MMSTLKHMRQRVIRMGRSCRSNVKCLCVCVCVCLCVCVCSDLADGGVLLLPTWQRPVSRQLHGQAKIADHTCAIPFHQNIPAVQVPVRHRWFVHVCRPTQQGREG